MDVFSCKFMYPISTNQINKSSLNRIPRQTNEWTYKWKAYTYFIRSRLAAFSFFVVHVLSVSSVILIPPKVLLAMQPNWNLFCCIEFYSEKCAFVRLIYMHIKTTTPLTQHFPLFHIYFFGTPFVATHFCFSIFFLIVKKNWSVRLFSHIPAFRLLLFTHFCVWYTPTRYEYRWDMFFLKSNNGRKNSPFNDEIQSIIDQFWSMFNK